MVTNISPLDALAEPNRRRLLEHLRQQPRSVSELVSLGSISQPAVSQLLKVLREARLVRVDRRAQKRIYSIDPAGLAELRAYIDSFWDGVLSAFTQAAEEEESSK